MHIQFIKNGLIKEVKSGFSWTTFFFPGFPQLFRGEVVLGICMLLFNWVTFMVWGLVWSFIGNKYTAQRLVKEGFVPLDSQRPHVQQTLAKWNIAYDVNETTNNNA